MTGLRKLRLLAAALAVSLLPALVAPAPALAESLSEKQAELSEVKAQMEVLERRKKAARRRAEAASAEIKEVIGNLEYIMGQSRELERESYRLGLKIEAEEAKLAAKEAEVEARKGVYKKRLRDIYMNGQVNYLDVLLGARSFSDFSTRMYLLKKIIAADLELLAALKRDAEELAAYKAELEGSMRELKATQTELEVKRERTSRLRDQRSQVLYRAEEEEQQTQQEFDRLLAVSERITTMIRNMEASGAVETQSGGTGNFMWPCRGTITSYFGWRTHPIFGTTKYHNGMDIGVDYGTPILAADTGRVIYSGWLGGYGYCVMIDHGAGLVTLYGHNSSLTVYEGQYVNKGTIIAYAGSTGYATGPHCHFEVRLHGEVTEPLNYLPK